MAQFYTGLRSGVCDVYELKSEKHFVNTYEDHLNERGAPNQLISDMAKVETQGRVTDINRTMNIGHWQSEPHQQHQNPSERRFQTVKDHANIVLDRSGAPAFTWLLALRYFCFLLNHTYNITIDNIPTTVLNGDSVDISPLLRFHFWEKVYYKAIKPGFPSESKA